MEHFGKHLIKIVRNACLFGAIRYSGCSKGEIETLMKVQGVSRLPRLYREYLEVMGKVGFLNFNPFWSYESLLTIKQHWENDMEKHNINFIIPKKSFVFFIHHPHSGNQYRYFMTDHDHDDCSTYIWSHSDQDYTVSVGSTLREYFEVWADFWVEADKAFDDFND